MNTEIAVTKKCYRCDNLVRLKSSDLLLLDEEFTCCDVCRDKLNVEAGFAGSAAQTEAKDFPKDQATISTPPPAVSAT